jgi:equilibrative nucleoside transporter 1/2/3
MFLAATPYFLRRFESNAWIAANFQSSILSVSCLTNLCSVLVLAKLQETASYPRRIRLSLALSVVVYIFLALSAVLFRNVSPGTYFAFVLFMVFGASLATGMNQNGVFAYVSGFGQERYMQAIMAGQGIAGVLPCIVQILSVLAVPEKSESVSDEQVQYQSAKSAFAYFSTSVGVSGIALMAFIYLDRRYNLRSKLTPQTLAPPEEESGKPLKKSVPLLSLSTGQLLPSSSALQ